MALMFGVVDSASSYSCNLWMFWYMW